MKYLVLLFLFVACDETPEQEEMKKAVDMVHRAFISKECTNGERYNSICKISVRDNNSCYIYKGQESVSVDCSLYYELKKVIDGLGNK